MRATVVALEGVVSAKVTLSPPEARVVYWPHKVTPQAIVKAIQELGFGASLKGKS